MTMRSNEAVPAGLALACGVVLAVAGQALTHGHRPVDAIGIEGVVGLALSALGVATIVLWVLSLTVAVLAEVLQRHGPSTVATLAARCTPAFMRRLAVALLGLNLLAVPALAQAVPGAPAGDGPMPPAAGALVPGTTGPPETGEGTTSDAAEPTPPPGSPYWSPMDLSGTDGEARSPGPAATPAPAGGVPPVPRAWTPAPMPADGGLLIRAEARPAAGGAEVVVAPGDSLWSIVAGRLGPLATAAEVAEAWPAWYHANRTTIGGDPSLLLPGQVLTSPP